MQLSGSNGAYCHNACTITQQLRSHMGWVGVTCKHVCSQQESHCLPGCKLTARWHTSLCPVQWTTSQVHAHMAATRLHHISNCLPAHLNHISSSARHYSMHGPQPGPTHTMPWAARYQVRHKAVAACMLQQAYYSRTRTAKDIMPNCHCLETRHVQTPAAFNVGQLAITSHMFRLPRRPRAQTHNSWQ
jgi:hypothetical protein